jgi:hypothetical protein
MKHQLKPLAYMRYGDDWICFAGNRQTIEQMRLQATTFLNQKLGLTVNPKIDVVSQVLKGISFLGVDLWPNGRRLQKSVNQRIYKRITPNNTASYMALIATNSKQKRINDAEWQLLDLLE